MRTGVKRGHEVAGFLGCPWGVAGQEDEDAAEHPSLPPPRGMGPWMVPSHSPRMETGVAASGPSAGILAKMQIHGTDP